jgi:hypothetical protein
MYAICNLVHMEMAFWSSKDHPLDVCYYSVVDEQTSTELIFWFHLGNQVCKKIGLVYK